MKFSYSTKQTHSVPTPSSRKKKTVVQVSNTPFLFVGALFAIVGICLWVRIAYVQIIAEDSLSSKARQQQVRNEYNIGKRGDIIDRNNTILARSVEMYTISVKTSAIEDMNTTVSMLSSILQKPKKELQKSLLESKGTVLIARRVSDTIARKVELANLPGISINTEYGRVYPNKDIAGILLGFVGDDAIGLEGIEYVANSELAGKSQYSSFVRDARGKKLFATQPEIEEIEGKTVQLTIDMHIQYIAEQAVERAVKKYNAKWGGALVVEVKTGDILAWAEAPRFNPNSFKTAKPYQWKNRLATDAYEPGSSFKIFLVATALEEGLVTPESLIFCEGGSWNINNTVINDTSPQQWLTLTQVFSKSSNIGVAKIGLSLGIKTYLEYLKKLGFGEKTELALPQSTGITRANRFWSDVDIATLAFGQGISVTGLQLAQASLTVANGGFFQPLRIFMNTPTEAYQYRIFSEKTIRIVQDMLQDAVENGTGKKALVPDMVVGGKTGTAQKADKSGGYGEKRFASFVGMFPMEAPQYVVVVLVDEPTKNVYGGVVASPVFQDIANQIAAYKDLGSKKYRSIPVNTKIERSIQSVRKPILPEATSQQIVPNVQGMTLRKAVETLSQFGIVPTIYGKAGVVIKQYPNAGTEITTEKEYTLWLSTS